jgi:hypothetical protein
MVGANFGPSGGDRAFGDHEVVHDDCSSRVLPVGFGESGDEIARSDQGADCGFVVSVEMARASGGPGPSFLEITESGLAVAPMVDDFPFVPDFRRNKKIEIQRFGLSGGLIELSLFFRAEGMEGGDSLWLGECVEVCGHFRDGCFRTKKFDQRHALLLEPPGPSKSRSIALSAFSEMCEAFPSAEKGRGDF